MTPVLPWIAFDLPLPPSVNRFTRRLGNRSPVVRRWVEQADRMFMLERSQRKFPKICGAYEAEFIFSRHRGDLDNRIKPLMDWMERAELIQNDRLCERLLACWGPAPVGVTVRLRPWRGTTSQHPMMNSVKTE
jgi:Holliday junction resolvase RusA-like endonuclease